MNVTGCRCIEQGAECGHLPECPYYADLRIDARGSLPIATGWMIVLNVDGLQRVESVFTGPNALDECAFFQEVSGFIAGRPGVECFEIEVFRKDER